MQLTAGAQSCEFTADAGATRIVAGAAGVALIRWVDDSGVARKALMFPEQSYTLTDLQGEWLLMETETGSALSGHRGEITLDASGKPIAGAYCANFGPCETMRPRH